MVDLTDYPMLNARQNTPFFSDLALNSRTSINGTSMNQGVWNMIVSHRDLKIWCQHGWKPHRNWKVSQAKNYFGIKGSKKTLLTEFEALKAEVERMELAIKEYVGSANI